MIGGKKASLPIYPAHSAVPPTERDKQMMAGWFEMSLAYPLGDVKSKNQLSNH